MVQCNSNNITLIECCMGLRNMFIMLSRGNYYTDLDEIWNGGPLKLIFTFYHISHE